MSINALKRKELIQKKLSAKGKVKTAELVKELNVSSETIRRYLEEMAEENLLKKVWGGAVKIAYNIPEPDHLSRSKICADEKKRIGKKAATLINDNDIIAIDEGTTNLQLIKNLHNKKNLTIITSSYPSLTELIKMEKNEFFSGEIIFIGGRFDTKNLRTSGVLSIKMMDDLFVDKTFISTVGIIKDYGVTSYDGNKALLSQKYIEHAKTSIIMCDHSKIGVSDYYKIANLNEVDIILSDTEAPEDWGDYLQQIGTEWIVAE